MNGLTDHGLNLFIDMDRVLVDIEAGFTSHFGVNGNGLSPSEWWKLVRSCPDFFSILPKSMEFDKIISLSSTLLHHYGVRRYILTACPRKDYQHVATQKRIWLREACARILMLPSPTSDDKVAFIQHVGDMLIDDKQETLDAWEQAGGKGFYYDCKNNNFEEVREQIMKYLKGKGW